MRHLTYQQIQKVYKKYPEYNNINCFVETGTYMGGTIFPMSRHFKKLYTIEISPKAYQFCVDSANKKKITNIKFLLGDSFYKLKEVASEINEPAIYFLDGHVTENGTGMTGRGKLDVPLMRELEVINVKHKKPAIIFVDDYRLFGMNKSEETAEADWKDINSERLLNQIDKDRIVKYYTDVDLANKIDRLIIILGEKKSTKKADNK